jgi:hypothetical protein
MIFCMPALPRRTFGVRCPVLSCPVLSCERDIIIHSDDSGSTAVNSLVIFCADQNQVLRSVIAANATRRFAMDL